MYLLVKDGGIGFYTVERVDLDTGYSGRIGDWYPQL